ncbi:hypothetical protein IVB30_20240 [Bradyrhizobium sp. 200]|uniref:hypothetical protein n=1 Tax=Bradyrhizobium sp. 200 TaxID=2782665 RepID=UPI001FFE983F|nr:hypothetical protein [Bradyrhizobium sp. 200]UPJ53438.1 hypothetical protein IVB30_20240 [Bradyrhizobium sp. 200]
MATDTRFGYGLKIDDGDIAFERPVDGERKLRLREVSGVGNLMQALALRVQTPLGNDRFNTTYGLDIGAAFVQATTVNTARSIIKLNLVRTLGTDPRISEVIDVQFIDDPAYRARHPDITDQQVRDARHRRVWNVDILLRTDDGETKVLPASVGA